MTGMDLLGAHNIQVYKKTQAGGGGGAAANRDINLYSIGTLEQAMHYKLIVKALPFFPVRKGGVYVGSAVSCRLSA